MNEQRLKQLMDQVGLPNSRSLYGALQQAHMEGYQQLEAELQQARQTADFWKAEHLSGNQLIDGLKAKAAALETENTRLREALDWDDKPNILEYVDAVLALLCDKRSGQ